MRPKRIAWHDNLFLVLLAVSVLCYCLTRFFQVRVFSIPAMVLMAPRSLIGGAFQTLDQLRRENARLGELSVRQAIDNGYWRDLAGAAARDTLSTRYALRKAAVVGRDPQSLVATLVVDQGLLHGVRNGLPAITEAGVAGKVIEAGANLSFVATLLNPRVKIAALDLRSRVAGVTTFKEGSRVMLDYILPDADVTVGDTIITSGTGGVFPKGLLIGVVERVDSAPKGMFRPIAVRPGVNIATLESMYLIEARDWDAIERRRREAEDELRAKRQKELLKVLDGSQVELKTGEAGGQR